MENIYTIGNFRNGFFSIWITNSEEAKEILSILQNENFRWVSDSKPLDFIPSAYPYCLLCNQWCTRLEWGSGDDHVESISAKKFLEYNSVKKINNILFKLTNDNIFGYFKDGKIIKNVKKFDRDKNLELREQLHQLIDEMIDDDIRVSTTSFVKVIDKGGSYSSYDDFFDLIDRADLKELFAYKSANNGEMYELLDSGIHEFPNKGMVLVIKSLNNGKVYLIRENCVEYI